MKISGKVVVVAGVGLATLAYLWFEHGPAAKPKDSPGAKLLETTDVPVPRPHARRTASNAKVTNTAIPDEPFTQLQLESAAALGFANTESAAGADPDAMPRALNEDLAYLGIGG